MNTNHHEILVAAPVDLVGPEAILWGEASWWPRACAMRFERLTPGVVGLGTEFAMRINPPLGPRMRARVTRLEPGRIVERTFTAGMFKGNECVTCADHAGGTRVTYTMLYDVQGAVTRLLWPVILLRLHDVNIELLLRTLKDYAESKVRSGPTPNTH